MAAEPPQEGMVNKYIVHKRSTGEVVEGEVFVLKPENDRAAQEALLLYAHLCGNAMLKRDIEFWIQGFRSDSRAKELKKYIEIEEAKAHGKSRDEKLD